MGRYGRIRKITGSNDGVVVMMNSKDRVCSALSFEEPDRIPISARYVPEIGQSLRKIEGYDEFDLGVAMGNDIVFIPDGFSTGYYYSNEEYYTCDWGCRWENVRTATGVYSEIIGRPLEDEASFSKYIFPVSLKKDRFDYGKKIMSLYGRDFWTVGYIPNTVFECAWGLRGLEKLLVGMVVNKEFVHMLMDRILDYYIASGKKLVELGVDMIFTGDDVAMQNGMMMSLGMWREFLKPRYEKLYREMKRLDPGIKIAYHSDGNCEVILDELYEIGLDVINPVQPACMDPVEIKKRYGKKLSLWGGLCVQKIMPFGTTEDVRDEVKRLKKVCGKGGGYILSPAHNIQSDTCIENILAFYDEAGK